MDAIEALSGLPQVSLVSTTAAAHSGDATGLPQGSLVSTTARSHSGHQDKEDQQGEGQKRKPQRKDKGQKGKQGNGQDNSRTVDPGPEMMAYPGNLNLQATMQYRERVNASPLAVQLHRRFDYLLGHILFLEKAFGLIKGLLPGGLLQGRRKVWSWFGVLADGRDAGNWAYAVVMRSLLYSDSSLERHDQCGDVLLGDIIEAVLHLGYNLYRHEVHYFLFARLFNEAVLTFERIETWATSQGYWKSSRAMANLML